MKRYVRGGAQEAAEILIALCKIPHTYLRFEYEDGPEGETTIRCDVTAAVNREIEEEEA